VKTTPTRAGHVNAGTSIPRDELPWPATRGRVMRLPKNHLEVVHGGPITPYGGVVLVAELLRRFRVTQTIDEHVSVLKWHLPYTESDHVIAQAINLYIGGTCIEDMASIQHSAAMCRMLGAVRLPDPTTGGDFLRRFDEQRNPGSLAGLRTAVDLVQDEVWRELRPRRGRGRARRPLATVDLDGHEKRLYGTQKEGADFSHTGHWSYMPLLISLAQTGECLSLTNRPGNARSSDGAAEQLAPVLRRLEPHFDTILVRGDSDFDRADLRAVCEKLGAYFAFVGREHPKGGRARRAMMIDEDRWLPYRPRASRLADERPRSQDFRPRRKKPNRRRRRARERGYKELRQVRQWVTEVPYYPVDSEATWRLVIRRQLVEHHEGQVHLFDEYRYHYIVTDLPLSMSTAEVVDETYQRCDQENLIEQLGSGLAAWRMPVAEFHGNCAWLEIARLAWNMAKWIAELALPLEVLRWEWKRFRHAFVHIAAEVVKTGRQVRARISSSHRFWSVILDAQHRLAL
jgi:hypothetical protein